MPNRQVHLRAGAITGALTSGVRSLYREHQRQLQQPGYQIDWLKVAGMTLAGTGVGAILALLPDILEPATDWRHRKFFHSMTTAGLVAYATYLNETNQEIPDELRQLLTVGAAGYLSHLVLDSQTPIGLPII